MPLARLLIVVGALTLSGCGGGKAPTAPAVTAAVVNISGDWVGTLESDQGRQSVFMTLTQTGQAVNGGWAVQNDWEGTITGVVEQSIFVGEATVTAASPSRGVCSGRAAISGTASSQALAWSSTGFAGTCADLPADVRFTFQR